MDKGYYIMIMHYVGYGNSSQSTIKMDKGYYWNTLAITTYNFVLSQSTIKMDKGYYQTLIIILNE